MRETRRTLARRVAATKTAVIDAQLQAGAVEVSGQARSSVHWTANARLERRRLGSPEPALKAVQ